MRTTSLLFFVSVTLCGLFFLLNGSSVSAASVSLWQTSDGGCIGTPEAATAVSLGTCYPTNSNTNSEKFTCVLGSDGNTTSSFISYSNNDCTGSVTQTATGFAGTCMDNYQFGTTTILEYVKMDCSSASRIMNQASFIMVVLGTIIALVFGQKY